MLIYEHLDGYTVYLLARRGLLDLEAFWVWLRGQEPAPPAEVPVETGDVRDLMSPAGPKGGRLPR